MRLAEMLENEQRLTLKDLITVEETIAHCAVRSSFDMKASLILAFTHNGRIAQILSKHKPRCPILVVTPNTWLANAVMLHRGVFSMVVGSLVSTQTLLQKVIYEANQRHLVKRGDKIVFISSTGSGNQVGGQNQLLKII